MMSWNCGTKIASSSGKDWRTINARVNPGCPALMDVFKLDEVKSEDINFRIDRVSMRTVVYMIPRKPLNFFDRRQGRERGTYQRTA